MKYNKYRLSIFTGTSLIIAFNEYFQEFEKKKKFERKLNIIYVLKIYIYISILNDIQPTLRQGEALLL